jgi:hypothetical protein
MGAHRLTDDSPRSHRAALVGLLVCLALVAGGLLLVHKLRAMSDLQDCVMQGRTNCVTAEPDR